MEELISTFHIEWQLIIAQLVNFAIVLFVLWKFAYNPILKTLNDRTKKIEKGVKDAEDADLDRSPEIHLAGLQQRLHPPGQDPAGTSKSSGPERITAPADHRRGSFSAPAG